jgi:hypothetical protein
MYLFYETYSHILIGGNIQKAPLTKLKQFLVTLLPRHTYIIHLKKEFSELVAMLDLAGL